MPPGQSHRRISRQFFGGLRYGPTLAGMRKEYPPAVPPGRLPHVPLPGARRRRALRRAGRNRFTIQYAAFQRAGGA